MAINNLHEPSVFLFLDWTGPTIEALNLCALPYCILLCQVQIGSRSKTSLYVTSWTIFKCQPVSSYEKCSLLITYLCHGTISNKCLSPSPSEQMSKSGSVDFRQISNILCWSMMELHLMLLLVTYWYWIGRCSMDQSSSRPLVLVIVWVSSLLFWGQRISDTYHCFCKIDTDMS